MKYVPILVAFITLPGIVFAAPSENAVKWLLTSQNNDGSWGNEKYGIESQAYISACAIKALNDWGHASEKGINWINRQEPNDTGVVSKFIEILPDAEVKRKFLDKLAAFQNADRGWGKSQGSSSSPYYTSSAIIALYLYNNHSARLGGDYLISSQGPEGSWSNSSIVTANCIYSLALLYNASHEDKYLQSALRGKEWLLKNQNKDIFSVSNSAIAFNALYRLLGENQTKEAYLENQKKIIERQNQNGSWGDTVGGDTLHTAWALSALKEIRNIPPVLPVLDVEVSLSKEHILPPAEIEACINAKNFGVLDVKNLTFSLEIPGINKSIFNAGNLHRNENKRYYANISISNTSKGTYGLFVVGNCTADNDFAQNISVNATLSFNVHEMPLGLQLLPRELKSGAEEHFSLLMKNVGDEKIVIRNISIKLDGEWKDMQTITQQIEILPNSEEAFEIFKAVTPKESGEYKADFILDLRYPPVEDAKVFHQEKVIVSNFIPSGFLKMVFYSALIIVVIFLLNLMVEFDILEQ